VVGLAVQLHGVRGGVIGEADDAADVAFGKAQRLAAFLDLDPGEAGLVRLDQPGPAAQDRGALIAAEFWPRTGVEGGAGARDGSVGIGRGAVGKAGDGAEGGRGDALDGATAAAIAVTPDGLMFVHG